MFSIPTNILLPLSAMIVTTLVYFVEAAAYYGFVGWYYRWGPAILRERWQTSGSVEQVRAAVRLHLIADGLVGRETRHGFFLRQTVASVNSWPRVVVRIEQAERGAALRFEVRPFYTMGLLIVPIVWLGTSAFGIGALTVNLTIGLVGTLLAIYLWIMPWDMRRINRLPTIRRALTLLGLHVCEKCGYDLFGHADVSRCPECGTKGAAAG